MERVIAAGIGLFTAAVIAYGFGMYLAKDHPELLDPVKALFGLA